MGQREILDAIILQDRAGALVTPPAGCTAVQMVGTGLKSVSEAGVASDLGGAGGGIAGVEITQAALGTNFDFTGLTGDTDGDYEFNGFLVLGNAGGGTRTVKLQVNGSDANSLSAITNVGVGFVANNANFPLGDMAATDSYMWFRGWLRSKSGVARQVTLSAFIATSVPAGTKWYQTHGSYLDNPTVITSLRLTTTVANGIAAGSTFRVCKLGRG